MPKTIRQWINAALTTAVVAAVIFRVPQIRKLVIGE
jgi:hypothetical protein